MSDELTDFVEQLEDELRGAAREHGRQAARRRRLTAAAAVTVAMVVVGAAVAVSTDGGVDHAYAAPPVTKRPVTEVDSLRQSSELAARGARLSEVRSLPAPGGTAYLVPVRDGWCLVGPDPATDHPQDEYALTCVSAWTFDEDGISLSLSGPRGGYVLIAPPAGARAPEMDDGHGGRKRIEVHDGVALASPVAGGTTITTYDRNGDARKLAVPRAEQEPTEPWMRDCGDGSLRPGAGGC